MRFWIVVNAPKGELGLVSLMIAEASRDVTCVFEKRR